MTESSTYYVETRLPSRVSLKELVRCTAIVKRGDAVDPDSAKLELPRAEMLAIASTKMDIVGVGAIKRKRPAYALQIAESSGFSFDQDTQEYGYVAVERAHQGQGLSGRIVAELLSRHKGSLFATTSDGRMTKTLANAGIVQKGVEWNGRKGQKLSLWIREWDIFPSQGRDSKSTS